MLDSISTSASPMRGAPHGAGAAARVVDDRDTTTAAAAASAEGTPATPGSAEPLYFISPVYRTDAQTMATIIAFRDSETGETVRQIPTEEELRAYTDALDLARSQRRRQAMAGGPEAGAAHVAMAPRPSWAPTASDVAVPEPPSMSATLAPTTAPQATPPAAPEVAPSAGAPPRLHVLA